MQTIKDYSYGVVPVRKEGGEWKVFILHQISHRDTYWTFPKGHPEEGETHEETALRELKEEAGLVPKKLDASRTFDQKYFFMHEKKQIEKFVSYYIGYITEEDFSLQPEEVSQAQWCTFAQARSLLTHNLAKTLLDEVETYLYS